MNNSLILLIPLKKHVRKPYTIVESTSNPCENTNTPDVKKINMNLRGRNNGYFILNEQFMGNG
jgi:hypothetical protein